MEGEVQHHLQVKRGELLPVVLVCGDPGRADALADLCSEKRVIGNSRGLVSYNVVYNGASFSISTHGMGPASCGIIIQELIALGARVIVRAGTCGALQSDVTAGDIVCASGGVTLDGVSTSWVPRGYPAVPDAEITSIVARHARASGANVHTGIVVCDDNFYMSPLMPNRLVPLAKAGCKAVEMECAVLFVMGSTQKVRTALLAAVDGNPLDWTEKGKEALDAGKENFRGGKEKMLKAALEACAEISKTPKLMEYPR